MRRILLFNLAAVFTLFLVFHGTSAKESATEEFSLEEIIVTSEKRSVNVQSIPASVQALPGEDMVVQGKVTVSEMLEDVPNVIWNNSEEDENPHGRGAPNNNITIRGIKRTQESGGPGPIPSATAFYVDGVFDGIGSGYDIDRIEVLRGPQGTLYGRSATGGVVAFYTKGPKLGEFGGNVIAEYGSGSRINTQGAINVPIGDTVALRAAAHYVHQEEGYRFNDKGGGNETKEGRIKALYQPTEQFSALLSLSYAKTTSKAGGWFHTLSAPDTIHYKTTYVDVGDDIPNTYKEGALELNYDLGKSALTYIGAIHTMESVGKGGLNVSQGNVVQNWVTGDPSKTQTHELRWASNTDGLLTWLIGGNSYKYTYKWENQVTQVRVIGDDDPNTFNAPMFGQWNKGDINDYGLFTEETLTLRDDMRITGGLRYDKSELNTFIGADFNLALKENGASLNPPNLVHFPEDSTYEKVVTKFDDVTYKFRFEYDLTPKNMLYAMTATGSLPGSAYYVVVPGFGPLPTGGFGITSAEFVPFIYDQQTLTSYEMGSKNRFLNDRLQLNGAVFYLDYDGYQEAVNITPDQPGPPTYAILRLPVRIYGLEADLLWLLTQYDKVMLTAGWLDAEATSYPEMPNPFNPSEMISAKPYMTLKRIPGLPEVTANLTYDHTFMLGNGSSLVPRAQVRYTSGYYLAQASESQRINGLLPYLYQGSVALFNLGASWTSPQTNYSITAYVRNVTDEEYKTSVNFTTGQTDPEVTVGDPRTWGIMASVRF